MRIRYYFFVLSIVLSVFISCGPGYKIGEKKIKKVKNIYDITVVKKSKHQYELERERAKQQKKRNNEHWRRQMQNRYKN